jgi:hypothetical protein
VTGFPDTPGTPAPWPPAAGPTQVQAIESFLVLFFKKEQVLLL